MNKHDITKLALMGIASGAMIISQTAEAAQKTSNNSKLAEGRNGDRQPSGDGNVSGDNNGLQKSPWGEKEVKKNKMRGHDKPVPQCGGAAGCGGQ